MNMTMRRVAMVPHASTVCRTRLLSSPLLFLSTRNCSGQASHGQAKRWSERCEMPSDVPMTTIPLPHPLRQWPVPDGGWPGRRRRGKEEEEEGERKWERGATERNIHLLVLGPPCGSHCRPARRPSESAPSSHDQMREEACRFATHLPPPQARKLRKRQRNYYLASSSIAPYPHIPGQYTPATSWISHTRLPNTGQIAPKLYPLRAIFPLR